MTTLQENLLERDPFDVTFRDLCPHCKPAQEWHFYDGIIPEVENGYI